MKAFQIKDFPDYYITDTGDVYSRKYHPIKNKNSRIIKMKKAKVGSGYLFVCLYKEGRRYQKLIHRLVAESFIANPENKPQVNHKDGNKKNNNVSNLEWATNSENGLHSFRVLKRKPAKAMLGRFGKNNPLSKIVLQIKDGKVIAEFYGASEAERETGVFCSNISACCCGKVKSAGGYEWKYKQKNC